MQLSDAVEKYITDANGDTLSTLLAKCYWQIRFIFLCLLDRASL